MKKSKNFLCIFLSFFLSLFILGFVLLFFLHVTMMSENYLRQQITKSMYVENLTDEILDSFMSYGTVSGFDENFFKKVLTHETVSSDVYREISSIYTDGVSTVNRDSFKNNIYKSFLEDVSKRDVEITETVDEALVYLAEMCADTYYSKLQLPYVSQASAIIKSINKVKTTLMLISFIAIIVISVIIFVLNQSRRRKLRYYIYSFSAAFLMLLIPSLVLVFSSFIDKINIINKSLYYLFVAYLKSASSMLLYSAIILGVITLFLMTCRYLVFNSSDL